MVDLLSETYAKEVCRQSDCKAWWPAVQASLVCELVLYCPPSVQVLVVHQLASAQEPCSRPPSKMAAVVVGGVPACWTAINLNGNQGSPNLSTHSRASATTTVTCHDNRNLHVQNFGITCSNAGSWSRGCSCRCQGRHAPLAKVRRGPDIGRTRGRRRRRGRRRTRRRRTVLCR